MARATKTSDPTYNTRRRFRRAAERFLKKADEAKSVQERRRWQTAAKAAIIQSIETYEPGSQVRGKVAEVAARAGVDPSEVMRIPAATEEQREQRQKTLKYFESRSERLKASNLESREEQGRFILSIGNIGHAIFGGLRDIWYDENDPEGNRNPLPKVLKALGYSDALELVEAIEAHAPELYTKGELSEEEIYDIVRSRLQYLARTNQL